MKIVSVEATKVEYPKIEQRTKPRPGPSRTLLNAQPTPMARYSGTGNRRRTRMSTGGRDVGCVVTAEDGTWGFGFTDHGRAVASIIEDQLAPTIMGEDPFATEKLYDMMYRACASFGSSSLTARATSAVDLALWDLKGKLLGRPVYELLGGPTSDDMPLYSTGNDTAWQVELGFKNFKRFSLYGPTHGIEGINRLEEDIAATRELVGPDAELMLDFWLGMDVETVVRAAERLRPYNLKWIEDPLLSETIDEYPRLRERLPWQTLATGEHWYTVYPFFHAAANGLVDIFQPDVLWVGGLTPLVKICHIAEAAGISVIPHGSGGTAFGQHACYGLTAIPMIECSGPVMTEAGVPLEEKDRFPGTPVPHDGHLNPSDAPGFGLELKREWFPSFFS
jgi:L-rhamnonate dehydratase